MWGTAALLALPLDRIGPLAGSIARLAEVTGKRPK